MIHLLSESRSSRSPGTEGTPQTAQSRASQPQGTQLTQPPQPPQPTQRAPSPADAGSGSAAAGRRTRANKACTNCARIKCKCIPRAGLGVDGYGCERCHRLGKTCEPSLTVVPSPRRARPAARSATTARVKPSNSRSARLEAKLNDLVDLLRTSQAISEPAVAAALATDGGARPNHAAGPSEDDADGDIDTSPRSNLTGAASGAASTAPTTAPDPDPGSEADDALDNPDHDAPPETDDDDDLLPHEAEACLRRFTEEMLPLAPFLYLPPDVTASRVRRMYPFLWRCIKAAASVHPGHRVRAASQARTAIVQRVVSRGERSMDILLGMLTFVSWVHLSTRDRFHRNFATVVAQLSVCVAWDLGLTMPPLLEPAATAGERFVPVVQIPGLPASMWKAQRSMEERRAVLGVYLVTATASQMFRSADGMRWSPYLDQCLAQLAQESTVPQDAILVQHVKMQLLISQVRYASSNGASGGRDGFGGGGAGGGDGGGGHVGAGAGASLYRSFGSGPTSLPGPYMDALRAQLDDIVGLPSVDGTCPAFDNFSTHSLYHFAMLAIHESALARLPARTSTATSGSGSSALGSGTWVLPDLHRFEIYQRCLASVQAWLARLFAWPLPCFVCLPNCTYLQLFYVIVCLHKLSTLRDPAWNVEAVRGVVDLFPTLDRILGLCDELRAMLAESLSAPGHANGAAAKKKKSNGNSSASSTTSSNSPNLIEDEDHDPILVAIRKFSTLKVIWQNEMLAQEREREDEVAAAAVAGTQATSFAMMNGQPPGEPIPPPLPTPFDAPPPIDLFSNYSLDVISYFHAMPEAMYDVTWP
ncbi:uncharacterized protein SPSK_00084 [Sporothrix schenckii 1099-18]|uniref:Zn(2)-C6 fungal-type domain-containing protein n=1 Tax=Sporothrix schenckii 1099-18 TaxID=1397361 RepID=A0A0F2M1X3_SPOSC|nr:uncharacterized protein SPSK_00084 [Sporothrix schenckii 1099-18]KJR83713.1 hypothetical protein SPSK_00084 [Sporothrix schenckii 1099-18]